MESLKTLGASLKVSGLKAEGGGSDAGCWTAVGQWQYLVLRVPGARYE